MSIIRLIDGPTGAELCAVATAQALSPETPRCAFCGRGKSDARFLFAGLADGDTICDRCVLLGAAMIAGAVTP